MYIYTCTNIHTCTVRAYTCTYQHEHKGKCVQFMSTVTHLTHAFGTMPKTELYYSCNVQITDDMQSTHPLTLVHMYICACVHMFICTYVYVYICTLATGTVIVTANTTHPLTLVHVYIHTCVYMYNALTLTHSQIDGAPKRTYKEKTEL
jgi:hypothetical protein